MCAGGVHYRAGSRLTVLCALVWRAGFLLGGRVQRRAARRDQEACAAGASEGGDRARPRVERSRVSSCDA
jgi:hypothetical protein